MPGFCCDHPEAEYGMPSPGCPHGHYSFANHAHGRVGMLREMLASEVDQFNNVSPASLRIVAQAAVT